MFEVFDILGQAVELEAKLATVEELRGPCKFHACFHHWGAGIRRCRRTLHNGGKKALSCKEH